jgi:4-aminobutyrate aminotransferase
VSCAAALATIALLEEGLIDNAIARGEQMQAALRPLLAAYPDHVRDVRGKGLLVGVQFDSGATAGAVEHAAFERGLMVLTAGDDVVRMSPPLVITGPEVAVGCRVLAEAVAAVAGR